MMRLCCLSLSFKPAFEAKQMDDRMFIDLCSRLELEGVDFNLRSFRSLERDHLKGIKKTCLEHGLTIACIGVNNDFGRPPSEQDRIQQQIRQGMDVAQFLGAPVVRLFAGSVRAGQSRDAVWKRCVDGLKRAADYAEKTGVMAALQNHNHKNLASTGENVLQLLSQVNHPWCSFILDTGQFLGSPGASGAAPDDARRHDLYKSIEQTVGRAVLVRAKLYRLKSGKEEWLDYDRIFRILQGAKYNGFVSLVYEGWSNLDAMHAVPLGVKFLRNYLFGRAG